MSALQTAIESLPSLATECVLIGHAQKADFVWTKAEFMSLCEHMLNGNEANFFMIPYRRTADGVASFAKAKKPRVQRHADWAWETVTGRAKTPASIGFYPRTPDGKSRWAAMDFDSHDGNAERARTWAFNAFQVLFRHPQLFVVLCTSGSDGWHLFVFTREFHAVDDWIRLLKQAAAMIGATLGKGACEIFPSDTRGFTGYGIRAPGAWNPKNGEFGLIAFQNVSSLCSGEQKERDLFRYRLTNGATGDEFTYGGEAPVYRGPRAEWKTRFAITAASTRREKMLAFVDEVFYQLCREIALRNVELQHTEASVKPRALLSEHIEEFAEYWKWREGAWLADLCDAERQKYSTLATDRDRDAFRIIHNFSRYDKSAADFRIVCQFLADRLGITLPGASKLRRRFEAYGIIEQTAEYVPGRLAARYRWIAACPATPATATA